MKKLAMICLPGLENFVDQVANALVDDYKIVKCFSNKLDQVFQVIRDADVVWLEWANEMAIQVTRQLIPPGKRVIIRLHSYEALIPQMLNQINWLVVTDVVFVTPFVRDYVVGMMPQQFQNIKTHIIPNFLESNDFTLHKDTGRRDDLVIGMLGHLNNKKGIETMCHAFNEIWHTDNEYDEVLLKIGGSWQDPRYDSYFYHYMEKTGLLSYVSVQPVEYGKANLFFEDVDVVLCTSPWESQNLSVMEGMLSGCKPAIHWFPGAEYHYREEWLWLDFETLKSQVHLEDYTPREYRNWIASTYDVAGVTPLLKDLIDGH